jgi:hypothetical protein
MEDMMRALDAARVIEHDRDMKDVVVAGKVEPLQKKICDHGDREQGKPAGGGDAPAHANVTDICSRVCRGLSEHTRRSHASPRPHFEF